MKFPLSAPKCCKLFHYIQYNFAGEKNIHQVHSQDVRLSRKKFFDLDILAPRFDFFFFFLQRIV